MAFYGVLTNLNPKTGEVTEIEIENFIRAPFKDGREVAVMELKDGTMFLQVTNPEGSGRNPMSSLWLSRESYLALYVAMALHNEVTGNSGERIMCDVLAAEDLEFEYSPNLANAWTGSED